jgi:hypothetical protein
MKLVEVIPTFGKQMARTPWITSAYRYAVIFRHRKNSGVGCLGMLDKPILKRRHELLSLLD